ncbi:hypothetical protein [Agrobacterium sp. NPDC089420]|uniref:hypothetical protein n=1 Tax=Agrobacterium sp. NPDC089420 TaxID=3363918 RepID=UPI00384C8834
MIDIHWGRKMPNWDCAEVETRDGTVCPFVAEIPGPDDRVMFSIDVPEEDGQIRSLASGFATDLESARIAAAHAVAKLDGGLTVAVSAK